jgi:hypothetical protein
MYANIRRYRAIGPVHEAVRRVQKGFVPILQTVPGLISYSIVAAGESLIAISVFQDTSAIEESNRLAASFVSQHLTDLVEVPPQVSAGEVLLHHVSSPEPAGV